MARWMRRRIERSRERCDKSAAGHKPDDKCEEAKRPAVQAASPPPQEAPS